MKKQDSEHALILDANSIHIIDYSVDFPLEAFRKHLEDAGITTSTRGFSPRAGFSLCG